MLDQQSLICTSQFSTTPIKLFVQSCLSFTEVGRGRPHGIKCRSTNSFRKERTYVSFKQENHKVSQFLEKLLLFIWSLQRYHLQKSIYDLFAKEDLLPKDEIHLLPVKFLLVRLKSICLFYR